MNYEPLMVDLYQLATLFAHDKCDKNRMNHRVQMSFFSRKMPANRNYIVFAGLRQIFEHMNNVRLTEEHIRALESHPMIGPLIKKFPGILAPFHVDTPYYVTALQEGTLVFAAPGYRMNGEPFMVSGSHVKVYEPYIQVDCNFVLSKLIESPWLSYINYTSMVASKAARVVDAADGKPVLEFGQRRTHPYAALDAAYAAYLAGCAGTSNVAAFAKYGIPAVGTMDHFAVMGNENDMCSKNQTEQEFFRAFSLLFPEHSTLLVDTYDTDNGILNAFKGTNGFFNAIRIDSNVTVDNMKHARKLLDQYSEKWFKQIGETPRRIKIIVSDGLNEQKVKELAPYVDGFGVGENITCSPDAATGVGAVGKLIVNGYNKQIIKVAKGSGKMTLPGPVQVWRSESGYDVITLADEDGPKNSVPLLSIIKSSMPSLADTRAYVNKQIQELGLSGSNDTQYTRKIFVSNKFAALTEKLATDI